MNDKPTININELLTPQPTPAPAPVEQPTTKPRKAPAAADAAKWAEVHALSLKPGRWYKHDDDEDPMAAAVYEPGSARVAQTPAGIAVHATFTIPTPDGQPFAMFTRTATPEHPFEEIPAPMTKNGNPIKSESRQATATVAARVTPDERDEVKAMAAARSLTVSQLIRDALGLALDPEQE